MSVRSKVLILSIGYGEGHHAAARALAEELERRDCSAKVCDPCAMAHPKIFEFTRMFYHLCVRKLPWLWGVTYAQTDTADWSLKAHSLILDDVTEQIAQLVNEWSPKVILCTYPLFAHMLDTLSDEGRVRVPYAVVVTDSIEISRPWMVTKAPLIFLPDEHSFRYVSERYALAPERLLVTGFPVRGAFAKARIGRKLPTPETLRIVYGAYAPLDRVRADLQALAASYPLAHITVIAGERRAVLSDCAGERIKIIQRTDDMPSLFAESHIYIGKAGAATMFEAYSSELPVIVNYALPGQEQGNLALLLRDGAGVTASSTSELMSRLHILLKNNSAGWLRLVHAMRSANRIGGAVAIVDELECRFFV